MKLTKKQLSALQRIVGREQTRYDEIQSEALAGVHPSEKHFAITDGTMVVLFTEQPEGIPVGDRTETYCASINSGNPGRWLLQSLRPYLIRLRFANSFFFRNRNMKCFAQAASSPSRKKSEALGNLLLSLLREYVSASYS